MLTLTDKNNIKYTTEKAMIKTNYAEIGIIGGSGFYNMKSIENSYYIELKTPFGKPSEKILLGTINNRSVAFLSRHGIGHRFSPSEVNYRANLFAMKMLNVERLISISAVGSLKEELKPTDLVIPDQFFDNTFKRDKTFFENGIAAHVSMDEPTCSYLADIAYKTAKKIGIDAHKGGTYYNIEGPQFSSKAESITYKKLGFSIIGMTMAVESKLAKELEICFLPLAFVTDYDCWHHEEEAVSVEVIVKNFNKNNENAVILVETLINMIAKERVQCKCSESLENSIITNIDSISDEVLNKLEPVIGKYINKK